MSEIDDAIRKSAESMWQAETTRRLSSEEQAYLIMESNARIAAEKREKEQHVIELCGRFAVWAAKHDIPYNSVSPFAPGWMLGRGEGPPTYSVSHQGIHDTGGSNYSLLVNRRGNIRELRTSNVYNFFGPFSKHQWFSRRAQLLRYPMPTIIDSIAKFSAQHRVPWE